jgi:hypothetical protein
VRNLVLIHGTWGRAQPWHLPGSALRAEAEARGFTVYDYLWSGILGGLGTLEAKAIYGPGDPAEHENGADNGMLLPWLDAGEKLALFLAQQGLIGDPDLVALSHSHGLQVLTFACVKGAQFKRATSISGPILPRMQRARRYAMARIGTWRQYADPTGTDRTIIEGELAGLDPHVAFDLPEGQTTDTPGSGHSGLVNDAALRTQYGVWDVIET